MFDHWSTLESDPTDETTQSGRIVLEVRKRKALSHVTVPALSEYEARAQQLGMLDAA